MPLATLAIEDLRCIERAELELAGGANLLFGANGSGKSSILEAIFMTGRGRSFRTRNSERLIRFGYPHLRVFGRTDGEVGHAVGVQVTRGGGTQARIDGTAIASLAELSTTFPVQIVNPDVHKLVEEGAPRRRRWLDWAVFHVEPTFLSHWLRYHRALRQRNAALRSAGAPLAAWNHELSAEGERMTEVRRRVVDALQPHWEELVGELSGLPVRLGFQRGWPEGASLADALIAGEGRDRERATTASGPHRADVTLRLDGRLARDVLSRGQQKLVAIALGLAQLELLRAASGLRATLLLDDPQAELDGVRLSRFWDRIRRLDCQLVVTALESETAVSIPIERRFHVEQGRVEVR